jgi:hypothetical protein
MHVFYRGGGRQREMGTFGLVRPSRYIKSEINFIQRIKSMSLNITITGKIN